MQFAAIVPPGCEDLLLDERGALRTGATLLFANHALRNQRYREAYAKMTAENAGIVIMDNEIYEDLETLNPNDMRYVVQQVRPTLCIVPDVRGNPVETMKNAWRYLPILLDVSDTRFIGVNQGRNPYELEQMMTFWRSAPVQGVSVPMRVPGREMTRAQALSVAWGRDPASFIWHFLGVEGYPYESPLNSEWQYGKAPQVVSCDTAEPTTATLRGVRLFTPACTAAEVARPADFMTNPEYVETLHARKELLWWNFEAMRRFLSGEGRPVTDTGLQDRLA